MGSGFELPVRGVCCLGTDAERCLFLPCGPPDRAGGKTHSLASHSPLSCLSIVRTWALPSDGKIICAMLGPYLRSASRIASYSAAISAYRFLRCGLVEFLTAGKSSACVCADALANVPLDGLIISITVSLLEQKRPPHGADINLIIRERAERGCGARHVRMRALASVDAHLIASFARRCTDSWEPWPRRRAADCSRARNRGKETCRGLPRHFYSGRGSRRCARPDIARACMRRSLHVPSACPSYRKQRNACRDLASFRRRNARATLVP